jgi:hypothetical protein
MADAWVPQLKLLPCTSSQRGRRSTVRPARNRLLRQLGKRYECHSNGTFRKINTRFHIRKTHLTWEPPYGIEP